MNGQTYTVTAYRDANGYVWRGWLLDDSSDDLTWWTTELNGAPVPLDEIWDVKFHSVTDMIAARGELVPVEVDNVEALLAETLYVMRERDDYANRLRAGNQDYIAITTKLDAEIADLRAEVAAFKLPWASADTSTTMIEVEAS